MVAEFRGRRMLPSQIEWLHMYPHRLLVQQVLINMVKATQCPHCGRSKDDCKKLYGIHMFEPDMFNQHRPRCSIDLEEWKGEKEQAN